MKAGEFIEAVERFFLDIIGTLLPGFALLVSLCYVTGKPFVNFSRALFEKDTNYEWALLLGLAYMLGHAVTSLGTMVVRPCVERAHSLWKPNLHAQRNAEKEWLPSVVVPEKELSEKLSADPIFKTFLTFLFLRIPSLASESGKVTNFRTWRNLALSIAPEQSHLVYRFTFLSLLNLGAATVCIMTTVTWGLLLLGHHFTAAIPVADHLWLAFTVAASPLFLERYYYFNRIAVQLPFSTALAKLATSSDEIGAIGGSSAFRPVAVGDRHPRVYLAGGFLSAWQDTVMKAVPELEYFDPRSHGLKNRTEYTVWDLEAIRRSDYVFAYLEASNPGGYALALEVGYGKALGKCVIVVDEKSAADPQGSRYFEMVNQAADASFSTLQEGITFLQQFKAFA